MNELTTEERLMLWDALFAGYFNTPYTPTVAETVWNMKGDDIRAVLRNYSTVMGVVLTTEIDGYEEVIVEKTAKLTSYNDAKAAIDVKIGVEIKEVPVEDPLFPEEPIP